MRQPRMGATERRDWKAATRSRACRVQRRPAPSQQRHLVDPACGVPARVLKEEKEFFQEINSYSSLESEKSWDDLQKTKHSETELSHLCSSHQKELSGQVDSLAHESCCIANHRMRNTHWQR